MFTSRRADLEAIIADPTAFVTGHVRKPNNHSPSPPHLNVDNHPRGSVEYVSSRCEKASACTAYTTRIAKLQNSHQQHYRGRRTHCLFVNSHPIHCARSNVQASRLTTPAMSQPAGTRHE
ncbi:hypothetical protein TcWFU_000861 [Taenia crassiceps]|uniref:Uncharacterized protein n=1 Tax=Taenia crassiceps TaxID=6207 RepID=A0ABR4QNH5_9CEST